MTIVVRKRDDGYVAFLKEEPDYYARGGSQDEAVGAFVRLHGYTISVEIEVIS